MSDLSNLAMEKISHGDLKQALRLAGDAAEF